jgi:hypothetical protein
VENAAGESCLPLTHQNSSCRHTKPEKHPHGSESSNQNLKNSYMQGKASCKVWVHPKENIITNDCAQARRKPQIHAYLEAVNQHLGHSKPNPHTRKPFSQ